MHEGTLAAATAATSHEVLTIVDLVQDLSDKSETSLVALDSCTQHTQGG